MLYRVRHSKNVKYTGFRKFFILLISVLAMVFVIYFYISLVRPIVSEIAESEIELVVMKAINDSVIKVLDERGTEYSDIVTMTRDNDGNVRSLSADVNELNILKSDIINCVAESIDEYRISSVKIPIGSIVAPTLLSGHGPMLSFDLLPVSSVEADFDNEFSSVGINQTRHTISVKISVTAGAYLPGYSAETEITTHCIIAETLIVGNIPDEIVYLNAK